MSDDLPDLGPCCMCEGPGARNLLMLDRARLGVPSLWWSIETLDDPMVPRAEPEARRGRGSP